MKRTAITLAALLLFIPAPGAFAVNRDLVALQTQVQQLQETLERMQQSNDERMGVLRQLVQQTADTVSKTAANVDSIQRQMQSQTDGQGSAQQQLSSQMQALNDSVDELKSRMAKLQTSMTALQSQPQTQQPFSSDPSVNPATNPPPNGGLGMATSQPGTRSTSPAASAAPPLDQIYQGGIRDYNAAKYELAAQEFGDVLRYYPQDDRAGNAQFYLAEVSYRQGDYQGAVKGYDAVLEQYPGNVKAPTAQLRKAQSLQALNQREAAIREYRSLLSRYPQSPEAVQARSKLNGMGATITPKPSGARAR